jgi:hypothetical protein
MSKVADKNKALRGDEVGEAYFIGFGDKMEP